MVQLPDSCIGYIQQRSRVWNFGSSDILGEPVLLFSDLSRILDTKKTRTHTHNNPTSSRMYCTRQVLTDRSTQQVSIYERKVRKRLEVRNVAIPHLSRLDTHLPPLYDTCYTHPSFMAHPLDLALHTFHFPITNIPWLVWCPSNHCLQS